MARVLDAQTLDIMRTLRVDDHFSIRGESGVFQVKEWFHPVEAEPYVKAYKFEGAFGLTAARFIRVSRIEAKVPRRAA